MTDLPPGTHVDSVGDTLWLVRAWLEEQEEACQGEEAAISAVAVVVRRKNRLGVRDILR